MPKPPIDPDSFDKVNFVIDAWTTGCDAPWYIYVETMKPALLTAFITLITFGFDDVLRGFFRPKGLYKRRTAKRKGKRGRPIRRFPEIGNLLGHNLGGMYGVQGAKWTVLGRTLWRIDGAMEMVRFFWLVAAIAEDFAFDWTSLLFESYWCQDDNLGRFSYRVVGWFPIPNDTWKVSGFGTEDYEEAPPTWYHSSGSSGPHGCMVGAALSIKKHPAFPAPTAFAVRIRNLTKGTTLAQTGPNDTRPDGSGEAPVTGMMEPNQTFQIQAWMTGTPWASYGEGAVTGFEVTS